LTEIAANIGKSRPLLSSYINGSYKSPKDASQHIEVMLREYFKQIGVWDVDIPSSSDAVQRDWIKSVRQIGTIQTEDMERIRGTLNVCRDHCEMAIIISRPGLGKTYAVEQFAEDNEDVVIVECDEKSSDKTLLVEIAETLDINTKGSAGTLMNRVAKFLKKNPHLIVFDEADLIKKRETLEFIRRLYDKSKNVGIVLVGNMSLAERLITYAVDNKDYARISDRIGYFIELEGLSDMEAGRFIENINATEAARKLLIEIGMGRGIRQLVKALGRLLDVTKGKAITTELVEELGQIVLSFNA
jgi:DNA transposition AAA+ family ATPase